LPDWFGALNRDFRYQLTSIGAPAALYVAQEISGNSFKIAGGKPNGKVSWQVTGIRQDAWANAHRIPVEEIKPAKERGFYLYPELFGAPSEKSMATLRHPRTLKPLPVKRAEPAVSVKH
jgi:trimeric autotransporter adhesin